MVKTPEPFELGPFRNEEKGNGSFSSILASIHIGQRTLWIDHPGSRRVGHDIATEHQQLLEFPLYR